MMRRNLPPVVLLLLLVGLLAGLFAGGKRWNAEARNRRVEIGVEWAEVQELAQVTQKPISAILTQFKAQGVSTLILSEETLAALEQDDAIHEEFSSLADELPRFRIRVFEPGTWQRIENTLRLRNIPIRIQSQEPPFSKPNATEFTVERAGGGTDGYSVPMRYADLRSMGVGLPPEGVQAAHAAGLDIAGRVANFSGVNAASAAHVLRDLKAHGASTVIFSGDEVLGWKGVEKNTAALLRTEPDLAGFADAPAPVGMKFGAVEFSKQKGDATISRMLKGDYVRVHSIQAAEMAQLDETEIIERFVRAVRERNIRFCYVRLLPLAGDDPFGDNTAFLKKIARGMEKGGFLTGGGLDFGAARPFEQTGIGTVVFALLGLGVTGGLVGLACALLPIPRRASAILLLGSIVICVGLSLLGETGRRFLALLAGIAFPAWACLAVYPRDTNEPESLAPASCIIKAWGLLLAASGITLMGIVLVIGLLATRPFMVQTTQFLGIKAQHVVPIFLVALAAAAGGAMLPSETWTTFRIRTMTHLRNILGEPARFGTLLAGVIVLAALALLVARTGNDAGVGVSGLELKFRALLDRLLPVRPRTKEFLIGHPAFVLGLALWFRGRRKPAIPIFVVGSIGQVSFLNTFCHIHSPLIVSIWRGGLGLLIGALLGAVAFRLLELLLPAPANEIRDDV
jgi:hypothetical protein